MAFSAPETRGQTNNRIYRLSKNQIFYDLAVVLGSVPKRIVSGEVFRRDDTRFLHQDLMFFNTWPLSAIKASFVSKWHLGARTTLSGEKAIERPSRS